MKTYSAKPQDIEKKWFVIDADSAIVGRLAAIIATRLRGKHKAYFSPNLDCGDNIIVINADKVKLTGNKYEQKTYYWHTGYPGGIKSRTAKDVITGKHPERVIRKAVERMLPKGPMGKKQLSNLRVYAGSNHPHDGLQPEVIDITKLNDKNKR